MSGNPVFSFISKPVILFAFITLLSGCALSRYVDRPVAEFSELSCPIQETRCGVGNSEHYIVYSVKELAPNHYRAEGQVNVEWVSTGSKKWVEFYLLFMDKERVIEERRLKVIPEEGTFRIDVKTETPVVDTSLESIKFWTRS